jgi:hypothetical protein
MKTSIKIIIIFSVVVIAVPFLWQELPELSLSKKINAEKMSAFFTALGSFLTAVTIYLLYKQIKEQIEDRKAASRPDLYPERQFFTLIREKNFPKLTRDKKNDVLAGLISLHNIGLGAAKEIMVKWHFKKDILKPLITPEFVQLYTNRETERNHSFVSPNNTLEIQLPLMYLATLSSFEDGWAEVVWEELFLEISYKDIHDFECPVKIFKVVVYVGANYVSFEFARTKSILLTDNTTITSTQLLYEKKDKNT